MILKHNQLLIFLVYSDIILISTVDVGIWRTPVFVAAERMVQFSITGTKVHQMQNSLKMMICAFLTWDLNTIAMLVTLLAAFRPVVRKIFKPLKYSEIMKKRFH